MSSAAICMWRTPRKVITAENGVTKMKDIPSDTPHLEWSKHRAAKAEKLRRMLHIAKGKIIAPEKMTEALEILIAPGERVVLEGDNQKQASFLSQSLANVDPEKVNHLNMVISSVSRPEHLDIFESGIAGKLDFSYSGAQSNRLAKMIDNGSITVGAIHTYLELYGRMFVDLIPDVALVAADMGDAEGNLYTGCNTEETPVIAEAAAFHDGIVIAQVNKLEKNLPRVDIPGSWVDFVVEADYPYQLEALFTKDPAQITDVQVLMAMMVIRGIYERHHVVSLNHGVGFNTAAIELLLPTYGQSLGLKGQICRNWALNPHPTLIPAIESGWVESVYCFGGEVGMEKYIAHRPDVFFTGRDGSMRSNRLLCQIAGLYGTDLFIGSTLQMDPYGNSSTVTSGRLAGFGGAPNMGSDPHGRRHGTPAWLSMRTSDSPLERGRKLVVQMVETFQQGNVPVFVEKLDAESVGKKAHLPLAPVMVYGDDVTHVVTEEGIAYLYKAPNLETRINALKAIAGVTEFGRSRDWTMTEMLRKDGIVAYPEDLGIKRTDANRSLLAAKDISELVEWSGGLYEPPAKFRNW